MKHDLSKTKEQLIAELEELREQFKKREEENKESRQKYRMLIENSPDLIAIHNMTEIVHINKSGLQLIGATTLDEVFGKSFVDFIQPDDRIISIENIKKLFKGEEAKVVNEHRLTRLDGKVIDVEVIGFPINYGEEPMIQVIVRDITDRKQVEEEIIELKEFNESIVSNLAEGIILENDNGIIQFANPAMLKMLGYTEGELVGKHWNCLVPDDQIEAVKNANQRRKKGESDQYEMQLVRKDGERIFVLVRGTPNVNKGKYIGLLATFTDITERKQAEEALKESNRKFRALFENGPIGVAYHKIVYDAKDNPIDYYFVDANEAYRELTGVDPRGKLVTEAFPGIENDPFDWIGVFGNVARNGEIIRFEQYLEPNQRWYDCVAYQYKPGHFVAAFFEVTKRKQAEEAIRESEEKFSTFMDTAYDLMSITDKDGRFTYVNESMINKLEYSRDELIGKHITEILPKEAIEKDFQPNWPVLLENGKLNIESTMLTKNGNLIDCILKVIAIYDKYDNFIGSRAVVNDITERKQAEIKLLKAKEETLLKNKISNAIILADDDEFYNSILDMILETFNCKFGFFGYMDYSDEEKLICPSMTYNIWDTCQMPDKTIEFPKSAWAGIWGESLKTKSSIYKNSNLKFPAGHVQLENALAVPVIYKRKLLGQIVVANNREGFDDSHKEKLEEICNYISPLLDSHLMERKYESELISAKEKAEESNRLKTAFLNNMSHEIRTPLNGITGFIGIMQDGVVNDVEKKEYFDIINKSSQRLIATVTDIIDISKIEAGEVKVSKKKVSVNEILEEQYDFFYREAKSKGLELIYKPNLSDKEALVITDKNKLEGILTNLIKNAIKFTQQGEITFACSPKEEKGVEYLQFYVKDTGIGISANRIDAVFNRFEKADIEDTRVFEGSGLGLAITKSYVEMLGGNIRVTSEEGKGSTFTFSIPYTKQVVKESNVKVNTEQETQVVLSDLSVIIAEDDETSIMLFKTFFKNTFRNIAYTKTGQETIDKCRENPETDLILMDVKMPDMNGYEATREIRKFNSDVVIIAQTAYGLKGDRQKAIDSGCNDYIPKPIKKKVLIDKIRVWLNSKST